MFGECKKTLDINYCAIYKKRYNLTKFDDGSWCDSNAALATVFLKDESDTYQIVLLNTTMGGELRIHKCLILYLSIPLLIQFIRGQNVY